MSQETKKVKRKQADKEKANEKEGKSEENVKEDKPDVKLKYGPFVKFPYQRVWSRAALIFPLLFIVWYTNKQGKEIHLAKQKEVLLSRTLVFECPSERSKHSKCVPEKCGVIVADKLISSTEIDILLKIAKDGFDLGDSDQDSSILDLHSGVLSENQGIVNLYTLPEAKKIFNNADMAIYKVVRTKIQHAIAHNLGVPSNKIFLTKPTHFARTTNTSAITIHDKDDEYTALIYLNDYGRDFEGGRYILIDKNNVKRIIEPRKGRVSMFTFGNASVIENVHSGIRYTFTMSFTCDSNAAISDPTYRTN